MKIYVGVTDGSWYDYLRDHGYDEVNFWKPGAGSFKAVQEGDLFLFKLKAGRGGAGVPTGERTMPVLQAAHIRPYAEEGPHEVDNGLFLRSDLHTLFDAGYLTVTPTLEVRVSRPLAPRTGRTLRSSQPTISCQLAFCRSLA